MCVCVYVCVCVSVCVCESACVCACVRACMCACVQGAGGCTHAIDYKDINPIHPWLPQYTNLSSANAL